MASKSFLSQMRGFTLIEISIVLVVIGLLLSGGLVALAPVLENAKRTQTENTLTKIEDALLLYAIQNSCLPCPADGTAPTTDGNQALSTGVPHTADACADAAGVCFTGADAVVPWLTLGIQRSDAIDEWGTLLTYHVSTSDDDNTGAGGACDDFQDALTSNAAAAGGMLRDNTTTPISFPQGCLDVETEAAAFTVATQQAAYVLISHGPDTSGGFSSNTGTARTDPWGGNNDAQLENNGGTCDLNLECHQGDPIDLEGDTYFDDIVRWKTGPVLVFQCGDGACGNP